MKFGLFYIAQWHESRSQAQTIHDALEQIELADELGFDGVWLGEHHFSPYGMLGSLFPFAGAVAGRTKRIRIGTAVVVVSLHNPLLVAEQTAMLDVISGGRVELGLGSGYQRREFDGLGVDMDESRARYQEGVDVVLSALSSERLTFHGQFTNVDDLQIFPRPLQEPHPPVYMAVSTTPSSVEFAAKRGLPIILGGPTAILGKVSEAMQLWRTKMEEFGHQHSQIDPPVSMGHIYVAPTMEEAMGDPAGLEDFNMRLLAKIGSPKDEKGQLPTGYESWANRHQDREAGLAQQRGLQGTPEYISERLRDLEQQGINHVFGFFGYPGMPQKKVLQAIELFGTKVMPQFREVPTSAI
jgi:alkanesulfonate monooxygenase SsuD/methylene tetrahydromethanopterin reductase-like flavin-dependent oxidoreductase (luciferase family)